MESPIVLWLRRNPEAEGKIITIARSMKVPHSEEIAEQLQMVEVAPAFLERAVTYVMNNRYQDEFRVNQGASKGRGRSWIKRVPEDQRVVS